MNRSHFTEHLRALAEIARGRALLCCLLFLTFPSVRAKVLFSDFFSYPPGPLVAGNRAWTTESGTSGVIGVGFGEIFLAGTEPEVVSAPLADQPHAEGGLYAGFSIRLSSEPTGSGAYFASFLSGSRALGRVFATTNEAPAGSFRIGMTAVLPGPVNTVPVDLMLFRQYRVVLYYDPGTTAARVWVDPVTEADASASPSESTFRSAITSFAFRQNLDTGDSFGEIHADNLVVATTFEEARDVPLEGLWEYQTQNGAITITRYLGAGPVVDVPETLNGLPVTGFALTPFSFVQFPGVVRLTLPKTITRIRQREFAGLPRLEQVTFLGDITQIPDGAFSRCESLTNVTFPDTVTSIGNGAFENCSALPDIRLPSGLTRIGSTAFWFCESLGASSGKISIPASVTSIGDRAFRGCDSLAAIEVDPMNPSYSSVDGILLNKAGTTLIACPGSKAGAVVVPAGVTALQISSFAGCTKLQSVTLPDGIRALPENAFGQCAGLTNIVLPPGLRTLGSQVFSGTGLFEVSLPSGVTAIPDFAYANCHNLERIIIPEQVTSIGVSAFGGCTNATAMVIGRNVTRIGAPVVTGPRLMAIEVDGLNPILESVDGALFNEARTTLLQYPGGKPGGYAIPEGVRTVAVGAFAGAAIQSILIPNTVTSLQERAFEYCNQLTSLMIPDNVTSLGVACFQVCDRLTNVRVGRGVTTLPPNAFASCWQLSEISLPATLRTISELAFFDCVALRRIVIPASVRTLQGAGVFYIQSFEAESLEIYFEGNAPSAGQQALVLNPGFDEHITVFYRAGATGWKETLAGRPAVLWDPRPGSGAGAPGVREGKFGFAITGGAGLRVVVEACTDLAKPVWVSLGTHTLTGGTSPFVDADGIAQAARFYRFRSP